MMFIRTAMAEPLTIFISYAHKDKSFLQELQTVLKPYERRKIVSIWTDQDIVAGQKWDELIKTKLNQSEVVLFLVSPDFLASDYINDQEIGQVLERSEPCAIPILVRPIDLSLLTINYLQVIPTGAKPVTDWESRDKAWLDVVNELKEVFIQLKPSLSDLLNKKVADQPPVFKAFRSRDIVDSTIRILLLVLIIICAIVFVYGLIKHDAFYTFTAIAGIAAGLVGNMFTKRPR